MRYAIVIENAGSNYSAYVPDLPGCIATGETVAEIGRLIREAIEFISMAYGRTARRFHRRQAVSTTSKSPCERQP